MINAGYEGNKYCFKKYPAPTLISHKLITVDRFFIGRKTSPIKALRSC